MSFKETTYPHLTELKKRVKFSFFAFILAALPLLLYAQSLYHLFATPLLSYLPPQYHMIATDIITPFWVPLKLALWLAFFISTPIFLYQLWQFITPGLYPHEKKGVMPLFFFSVFLFYAGLAFAHFIVLPIIFKFLIKIIPPDVQMLTDMNAYYHFVVRLMLAFGLAFQIPIITTALIRFNIIQKTTIQKQRGWVIIAAFFFGMLLTPPDIFSQTLLAVPLWLLFELGMLIA